MLELFSDTTIWNYIRSEIVRDMFPNMLQLTKQMCGGGVNENVFFRLDDLTPGLRSRQSSMQCRNATRLDPQPITLLICMSMTYR